ncbi:hypothetical protein AK812_SmicGene38857 [Symbiodinium microadriaticum]|uniref:Uncharacterized protein n=1 Tax=Symbiodinium microadriaticum TaxID=2951 RepID=A0A1Q9CCN5_SYMMI|nr:hypothetical protein AK812_SmicGene38857 [Symbiodinium microadriaticum]
MSTATRQGWRQAKASPESDLHTQLLPSCRAGWPAWGAAAFQAACQAEQVDPPAPAPDHDTTSRQHRHATAPQPPPSVLAFCCPRILLANPDSPSRDEAWQELPDRHMHWAPVFHRQSNQWAPEWVCLRCNATVTSEQPLLQGLPPDADRPVCPTHGPRCLALDLREGSRGWICSRGAQVLPCRAVRIPLPPANPEPGPAANAPPDADFAWFRRGPPPPGTPPGPTHSWIFVPLLHAAVGHLHPDALQAWETDSHYGALWSRALANLRLAGSVPPASVVHALHILQQLSSEEGGSWSSPRTADAARKKTMSIIIVDALARHYRRDATTRVMLITAILPNTSGRPQPGAATRDGAASVLPTLRCCGRVRSDCASSLAKLEAVGPGSGCDVQSLCHEEAARLGNVSKFEHTFQLWGRLSARVAGFGPEAVAFLRQLAKARARESSARLRRPCSLPSYTVGRTSWLWRRNTRWLTRCLICPWRQRTNATARSNLSVSCSRMLVTPSQCPRADFRLRGFPAA